MKNLETELQAALSKPGGKNHEMIENIKQQHEEVKKSNVYKQIQSIWWILDENNNTISEVIVFHLALFWL